MAFNSWGQERFFQPLPRLQKTLAHVTIGQDALVEQLAISLILGGHCLLSGPPGADPWMLVDFFSRACGLDAHRVTATPDLDWELVLQLLAVSPGTVESPVTVPGGPPHVLLMEEIHRASPRVQARLLDAVRDGKFLFHGQAVPLPRPFLLIGTEMHDERERPTLTPVQIECFLLELRLRPPTYDEEFADAARPAWARQTPPANVVTPAELAEIGTRAAQCVTPPPVIHYALRLVRGTRVHEGEHQDFVYEWIRHGAGPTAARILVQAAQARAAWCGRTEVEADDLHDLAHPVLRHRITLNQNAASQGVTTDDAIDRLLAETPRREEGDERVPRAFRDLFPAS